MACQNRKAAKPRLPLQALGEFVCDGCLFGHENGAQRVRRRAVVAQRDRAHNSAVHGYPSARVYDMAISLSVRLEKALIVSAYSYAHVFQPRQNQRALTRISRVSYPDGKAPVERTVKKHETALTDVYRSVGFALFQKQIAHAVGGKAFAHRSEVQHDSELRSVHGNGL